MKLLVITQKIDLNDDLLGFFNQWLFKLSQKVDKLYVISLEVGVYQLPKNVEIFSLGKEMDKNKLLRYLKFYQLILKILPRVDSVFAHMCPEYVVALAPLNLFFNKQIFLWYVHRQVNWRLRLAEKFVKKIFTVSPASCRLSSKKIKILGHGIDLEKYHIRESRFNFNIIYVGRISKIKNQELLIKAANILINQKNVKNIKITLVGGPILSTDNQYLDLLKNLIKNYQLENYVEITGRLPFNRVINYYHKADLSINLCPTGGLDKAVLESMAMGLPTIVINKDFKETLAKYQDLILEDPDEEKLAERIEQLFNLKSEIRQQIGQDLRQQVKEKHDLENLINNLIKEMS